MIPACKLPDCDVSTWPGGIVPALHGVANAPFVSTKAQQVECVRAIAIVTADALLRFISQRWFVLEKQKKSGEGDEECHAKLFRNYDYQEACEAQRSHHVPRRQTMHTKRNVT